MTEINRTHKRITYIIIVIISSIFDMCLHVITSNYTVIPKGIKWNCLSKTFSVPFMSALWAFLAFGTSGYIFIRYQNKIPGTKFTKGLYYGTSIAFLWLIATLAGVSTYGNRFINEFVTGSCDAIPTILMGCLLSIFSGKELSTKMTNQRLHMLNVFFSIMIFSMVFSIGRYFAYYTNIIKSGYQTNPNYTLIWTILMGMFIGIIYLPLRQATQSPSVIKSSITFGLTIFGANWAVFGIFMPLLLKGFIKDFIFTVVVDIILVITSCYISETFLMDKKISNNE